MTEMATREISSLEQLLDCMWSDYVKTNPNAQKIHDLFVQRGDQVENDHVALRTFNLKKVGIEQVAKAFKKFGYQEKGDYHFEQKKLYAKHYEHENSSLPKIFISELLVEEFSPQAQKLIAGLVDQVSAETLERVDFSTLGRPWKCDIETYETLKKESEYAAWVAAFGYRANHFTVFINNLESFEGIEELNQFVKESGYALNSSGGEIKGSKDVLLEQSSTIANNATIQFEDGSLDIPSTYYEFAKRYELEAGKLYQGFVAKSADKIFESTNQGQ